MTGGELLLELMKLTPQQLERTIRVPEHEAEGYYSTTIASVGLNADDIILDLVG